MGEGMDSTVRQALANDPVVDITTLGRKSREPKRIEIWIHASDGRYFITGRPGKRSWYANLVADGSITVHLKGSVKADLAGRARAITDRAEKRDALRSLKRLKKLVSDAELKGWVDGSPLVEVVFDNA